MVFSAFNVTPHKITENSTLLLTLAPEECKMNKM